MNKIKAIFKTIYKFFQIIFYIFKMFFNMVGLIFKGFKFIIWIIKKIFTTFHNEFRKLLRFSLTFKITFVYAVIISITLFFSSIGILLGFGFFLNHAASKDMKKNSSIITSYIMESPEIPYNNINEISKYENINIALFNEDRKIIFPSNDTETPFYKYFTAPTIVKEYDKNILVFNREIYLNENTLYLQLSKSLSYEYTIMVILFVILLITNIVGIIIIIAIGFKMSKKMLHPIKDMTEGVKAITIQNLDTRLDVGGAYDELRDLAVTFNEMFDKIQASYEKQNQFVSDASHELRTPISVIQGYINLLDRWGKDDKEVLEEAIVAIKGESEAMKNLIEKLLFLARSDKNLFSLQQENFYMSELINEIIYETRLIDSRHKIIGEANKDIVFNADKKLLKQAIRIFLDNSVKFTPKDGTIKILSYLENMQLIIIVEDTGIGIPKEDINYIFNRFYRSDKSRTKETGGHGLGLSIAKLIIDAHDGYIEVDSTVDIGTKIKILLPYNNGI